MPTQRSYDISEVSPYINWAYFLHAWGMTGKPVKEQQQLIDEAKAVLAQMEGRRRTQASFALFDANSQGDDILLFSANQAPTVLPMLRQQQPDKAGAPCFCLADFIRPLSSGVRDRIGVFATTAGQTTEDGDDDPYKKMMAQTLADRLAEATAERLHLEVRTKDWRYAPDEQLSMEQLHREDFQGIRPAVGYPSLPDMSLNFILTDLIGMKDIGIRLTSNGMMMPHASVSGLMLAHPKARYFNVGAIGNDQLIDYARRRGVPVQLMRRFLNHNLLKK